MQMPHWQLHKDDLISEDKKEDTGSVSSKAKEQQQARRQRRLPAIAQAKADLLVPGGP